MEEFASPEVYLSIKTYVIALLISLPRAYAFIAASQILSPSAVPRLARTVSIIVITLPIVPANLAFVEIAQMDVTIFAGFFLKEYALGFLFGYLVSWLFWAVQASGAFIDNQRGAAIASSIDPMQGHESSPLGILFSQAFITYFFSTGGFLLILSLLYKSYGSWPVYKMIPVFSEQFPAFIFAILDNGMQLMFILAAPIIAIMFLAEFSLALVSRFAPQIQVFILAMPIKSAIAITILIFYFGTLLSLAKDQDKKFGNYFVGLYNILKVGEFYPAPDIDRPSTKPR